MSKTKVRILLISLIAIFLIIIFIGFLNLHKNVSLSEKENKEKYEKILESAPPEFKEIINFINTPESKVYREINFMNKIENLRLSNRKTEIEAEILEFASQYVKNIKINENKDPKLYANEIKDTLNKMKFIQIDFNDKESLKNSGDLILSITNDFSKIEVPKEYYNFHKAEAILLSGIGYSLKNLALTDDSEYAYILTTILDELTALQEKLIEKL
jgi:flagellar basal body-associated protein FliL